MSGPAGRITRAAALGGLAAGALVLGAASAAAGSAASSAASSAVATDVGRDPEDAITAYDMTIDLGADGVAHVTLDLTADFGERPNHGPYLTWVVKERFDDERDRVYRITDVDVSSDSAPDHVERQEVPSGTTTNLVLRIGDEDREITGAHRYTVTFDVEGWVNAADYEWPMADDPGERAIERGRDYDELYLDVISGWNFPVRDVRVTVNGPNEVLEAGCADRWHVADPCDEAASDGATATFGQAEVGTQQPLTIAVAYPTGSFPGVEPVVQYRWSPGRAFALTPATAGGALAVAAVGGALLLRRLRRTGVDEQFLGLTPGVLPAPGQSPDVGARRRAPVAVQFTPPAGFRAGQLGTLVDEAADPRDVTATIIDLAVRGYLRITQVDDGEDWRLERTLRPTDDLLPYEDQLYMQLFAGRESVELSELRSTFAAAMAGVQNALYVDVTERGWFRRDPSAARSAWAGRGVLVLLVGVAVTVLLAIWTQWALVGLALVLVGVVWLAASGAAPARTAAGTAVLAQAEGFRHYLATAEAEQLRFEEGEDLFSRYLPLAVAFGLTERWADLFAQLAAQGRPLPEPTWYVGHTGLPFWAAAGSLGTDLSSFADTTEAALTTPAPGASGTSGGSAFGGGFSGGFGGGGVSGGGGGSW